MVTLGANGAPLDDDTVVACEWVSVVCVFVRVISSVEFASGGEVLSRREISILRGIGASLPLVQAWRARLKCRLLLYLLLV